MPLRHCSYSGMPSVDACCPNAALIMHIDGVLEVLDNGLPGGVEIFCCVLVKGYSVSLLVGWHTIIPSGIAGGGIETFWLENRAKR